MSRVIIDEGGNIKGALNRARLHWTHKIRVYDPESAIRSLSRSGEGGSSLFAKRTAGAGVLSNRFGGVYDDPLYRIFIIRKTGKILNWLS